VSAEKLQAKIVKKAQEKGADAVVLTGLDRYKSGENTDYHETTENKGRKTTTHGHSSTSSEEKKEIQAIFIKYR
jgi:methylmalonyl-CoA mutase cobalamin-binding subunit